MGEALNALMLGFIFVIVAFFVCLAISLFICQHAGACGPLEFGITATAGVFVFIIFIIFLKAYTPAP